MSFPLLPQGSATGPLVLIEGEVLGEGAFSRVCKVTEQTTGRTFAMKRMAKTAAMQCPEHIFDEQYISKNHTTHTFCIRQYASFKDMKHLYFIFDVMPGAWNFCRKLVIPSKNLVGFWDNCMSMHEAADTHIEQRGM